MEVDCLTGDARIVRADIVMDVGASINPVIDVGQIEGAYVQGYGWLTTEELIWGDEDHPWVRVSPRREVLGGEVGESVNPGTGRGWWRIAGEVVHIG